MRIVIITPAEEGGFVAECPSLPGCMSEGETREATIENIKEAMRGYIAALEQDGLPVPGEVESEVLELAV
ncbi:MAG: type II toxin-antitoxin system HicB family antitoxin [Deltaproteobacteria bacterium]|nr:type II toxin-antitoxin system HicB family antitoxin [Deltaproteobacteria bacterium]